MTAMPAVIRRSLLWAFVATALVVTAAISAGWVLFWLDLKPDEFPGVAPSMEARVPLVIMTTAFAVIFCSMLVRTLFRRFVEMPWRLAEDVRLLLPQSDRRLEPYGGPELQAVAAAVNELAALRQSLEDDVTQRIGDAMRAVEEEKNRLAALMSELTQSVVVCNLDGRILLYNSRARVQFRALSQAPLAGGGEILGLGRSIYAVFERELITHALESIQARLKRQGQQAVSNFVTTTRGGQLLRVQMAPVFAASTAVAGEGEKTELRAITGYVLMLDNITVMFDKESKRDELLQSLTEGNRAALGNIRAAIEMLIDIPDMEGEQRDRFLRIIADEAARMSRQLDQSSTDFVDALKARWPLEEMRGSDLIAAAARHIDTAVKLPVRIEEVDEAVWLKVDSFSVLQMLTYLAARLSDEYEVRDVRFRLARDGRLAHIDLCWHGATMSTETVMGWEMEPMHFAGQKSPLTVREVIERCNGEIWFQRERVSHLAFFRIVLPAAVPTEELDAAAYLRAESRPDYYDFNLFERTERSHALDDCKLSEIAYTVFDTETTGLDPSSGDEIIQIGATRILNGKLLRQEYFDQLIDPQRNLPATSTAVHGITPDMLVGQPAIDRVLPAFHAFAEETVLIAHNAAFDMRFLQLKEERTGCRFNQPVLDTLLLSAVIHPNQETHRLEAIAERFGIPVIGRHTAMGDAIVTGEVFLRMIPLLADKGIVTLRQAIDASQATYYARIDY
jgi:DNA polymerase III subunit epsilon